MAKDRLAIFPFVAMLQVTCERERRVTAVVFTEWLNNCFVHEVENYLVSKNLAFKVLLLLYNAPGHPESL